MSYKDEVINTALNKAQLEHKKPLQHSAINNVLLRTIQQHTIHAYFIPYDRDGQLSIEMIRINYHEIEKKAIVNKRQVQILPFFKQKAKECLFVQITIKSNPFQQPKAYHLLEMTLHKAQGQPIKRLFLLYDDWLQQEDSSEPIQMEEFLLKHGYKASAFHHIAQNHVIVLTEKQILICDCQTIQNQLASKKLQDLDISQSIVGLSFIQQSAYANRNLAVLMGSQGNLYPLWLQVKQQQVVIEKIYERIRLVECLVDAFEVVSGRHNQMDVNLMIVWCRGSARSKQSCTIYWCESDKEKGVVSHELVNIENLQYIKQNPHTFFQLLTQSLANHYLLFLKYHQILLLDLRPFFHYLEQAKHQQRMPPFPQQLPLQLLTTTLNTHRLFINCPSGRLNILLKGKAYLFISEDVESLIFESEEAKIVRTIKKQIQKTQEKLKRRGDGRYTLVKIKQLNQESLLEDSVKSISQTTTTSLNSLHQQKETLQSLANKANHLKSKFSQAFKRKQIIKAMLLEIESNQKVLGGLLGDKVESGLFVSVQERLSFVNEREVCMQVQKKSELLEQIGLQLQVVLLIKEKMGSICY